MSQPQLIDDEEHERVFEKVAAVEVAKAAGMVCTRTPHPSRPGARRSTVWTVPAAVGAVRALAAQLAQEGIQKVTLESTSDYWRIWFYLLEEAGLDVQLVTASQARQLSGRPKTGRLDAMWLARLTGKGLLRASFVPPPEIRALRHYTRARTHLTQDRTRCWQRLEKLLEDALIKVSAVASKLTTVSAQDMIRALTGGERDPQVLAGLARGRMRARHAALAEALTGMFEDHHGELAQILLDQIAFLEPGSPGSPPGSVNSSLRSRAAGALTRTAPPAPPQGPARTRRSCPQPPGWMRSPVSAWSWPPRSSPGPAWT